MQLQESVAFSARIYCGDKCVVSEVVGIVGWSSRNAIGSFLLPRNVRLPGIDCTLVIDDTRVIDVCVLDATPQPYDTTLVNFASARLVQQCLGKFNDLIGDASDE